MLGRLHVLTDTRPGRDPLAAVAGALDGGAEVIQVRAKGFADRDLYRLAAEVVARCARYGAACVVDDRVDVALAVGAAGVHVGDTDLPLVAVRRIAGPDLVVGATARTPEAAAEAVRAGATYVGAGPCYATATKAGLPPAIGPEGIARVVRAVDVPVIAIGGIRAGHVRGLVEAGAHGVAVVGAVSEAGDPAAAAAELLAALGGPSGAREGARR